MPKIAQLIEPLVNGLRPFGKNTNGNYLSDLINLVPTYQGLTPVKPISVSEITTANIYRKISDNIYAYIDTSNNIKIHDNSLQTIYKSYNISTTYTRTATSNSPIKGGARIAYNNNHFVYKYKELEGTTEKWIANDYFIFSKPVAIFLPNRFVIAIQGYSGANNWNNSNAWTEILTAWRNGFGINENDYRKHFSPDDGLSVQQFLFMSEQSGGAIDLPYYLTLCMLGFFDNSISSPTNYNRYKELILSRVENGSIKMIPIGNLQITDICVLDTDALLLLGENSSRLLESRDEFETDFNISIIPVSSYYNSASGSIGNGIFINKDKDVCSYGYKFDYKHAQLLSILGIKQYQIKRLGYAEYINKFTYLSNEYEFPYYCTLYDNQLNTSYVIPIKHNNDTTFYANSWALILNNYGAYRLFISPNSHKLFNISENLNNITLTTDNSSSSLFNMSLTTDEYDFNITGMKDISIIRLDTSATNNAHGILVYHRKNINDQFTYNIYNTDTRGQVIPRIPCLDMYLNIIPTNLSDYMKHYIYKIEIQIEDINLTRTRLANLQT